MSKSIFILVIVALVLMLINVLARLFLKKIYSEADEFIEKLDEQQSFIPPTTKDEEFHNKIVMQVRNDNSSAKKDFNDIQNLSKKYNKNTYRATNGRFKSIKNATK